MCGKCGAVKGKIACASGGLGTLFMILAAIARLTHFAPLTLGPRSFAIGSALLFLMSITMHTCIGTCDTEGHEHH